MSDKKSLVLLSGQLVGVDDCGFFENRDTGEKKHLGYELCILGSDPTVSSYRKPRTGVLHVKCDKEESVFFNQYLGRFISMSIRLSVRMSKSNPPVAVLDIILIEFMNDD